MPTLQYCFCLDSRTIGTDATSSELFSSRFSHYRDRCPLFETVFVPILALSRQMIALWYCFCLDSRTIGTDDRSLVLFLSRFSHYRDRFPIFNSFLVPIPTLSRQRQIPDLPLFSCPDSCIIKTTARSSSHYFPSSFH